MKKKIIAAMLAASVALTMTACGGANGAAENTTSVNKDLEKIILRMVASLNSMQKCKDRLIEITADGEISDDEIKDFVNIQEELERISLTVDSLKLWSEQMLANGIIDKDKYIACKNKVK